MTLAQSTNRPASDSSVYGSAMLESLEPRLMLSAAVYDGRAPILVSDLPSIITLNANGSFQVGINGYDADGDALTITASSSSGDILVSVPQNDTYARMHYKDAYGRDLGDIVVQLYTSNPFSQAAAQQFITLSSVKINSQGAADPSGKVFYTNVPVHRIIKGFMFQSGDAANKNGTGVSPLPDIADSFDPNLEFNGPGVLAYANAGAGSSNCQWFITDAASPSLNGGYIIFGQVISGQSTYDAIINQPVGVMNPQAQNPEYSKPLHAPILDHVDILSPTDVAAIQGKTLIINAGGNAHGGVVTVSISDGDHTIEKQIVVISPQNIKSADAPSFQADGYALARQGNLLYVGDWDQPKLRIIDISNPASFTTISEITLPDYTMGLQVVGTTAFICYNDSDSSSAAFTSGLAIYDVSDPANPVLKSTIQNPNMDPAQVAVRDNTLFLVEHLYNSNPTVATAAQMAGGFSTYDISDLSHPQLLDAVSMTQDTGFLGYGVDLRLKGNYAYFSNADGDVVIFNVAQPGNITYTHTVHVQDIIWDIDVQGDRLYVAVEGTRDSTNAFVGGRLEVYNLTNPELPQLMGSVPINGVWRLKVIDSMAIVGSFYGGVALVDVHNPNDMAVKWLHTGVGTVSTVSGTEAVVTYQDKSIGKNMMELVDLAPMLNMIVTGSTVTYTDGQDVPVTITITGGGTVVAHTDNGDSGNVSLLEISGATKNTKVTITTPAGQYTSFGKISANMLGSLIATTSSVTGDVVIYGGTADTITLNSLTGGTIQVAAPAATDTRATTAITLGTATDAGIHSDTPLRSLTVGTWTDTDDTADVVEAPSITTLTATNGFAADLSLLGPTAAVRLGTATIGGSIDDSTWTIGGSATTITATGIATNWNLQAQDIRTLTLGTVLSADFTLTGTITTLSVGSWNVGSLEAAVISSLTATGDFAADLTLAGNNNRIIRLPKATVGSAGGYWDIDGIVSRLTVTGTIDSWTLEADRIDFLTLADVTDADISSATSISTLTARSWLAGNLDAASVSVLTVTNEFSADVSLTGVPTSMNRLARATIGSVGDSVWDVTGGIASLTVTGTVDGLDLTAQIVSALTLGTVTSADITAKSISSLRSGNWTDGTIRAESISVLMATGQFQADLDLQGLTALATRLSSANITGNVANCIWNVTGGVAVVRVSGTTTNWQLTTPRISALMLGDVVSATLNVSGAISSISATRWQDGTITAGSIISLRTTGVYKGIAGDFAADVNVNTNDATLRTRSTLTSVSIAGSLSSEANWNIHGVTNSFVLNSGVLKGAFDDVLAMINRGNLQIDADFRSISTLLVQGNLSDSTINLTRAYDPLRPTTTALTLLNVTGAMNNVDLISDCSLGTITTAGFTNSNVLVGVDDETAAFDDMALTNNARINSFSVTGLNQGNVAMKDSVIAARTIGMLNLSNADTTTGPDDYGLVATTVTRMIYRDKTVGTIIWSSTQAWPAQLNHLQFNKIDLVA